VKILAKMFVKPHQNFGESFGQSFVKSHKYFSEILMRYRQNVSESFGQNICEISPNSG